MHKAEKSWKPKKDKEPTLEKCNEEDYEAEEEEIKSA